MNLSRIRYYLIWTAVIISLIFLPPKILLPLKSFWYQRIGLCLSIPRGNFYAGLYSKETARAAIPVLKKSLEYDFSSWEVHFLLGVAYSQLQDFAGAAKEYELCLRFNPGYAKGHYNLGNAYYRTKRYEDAIEAYRSCLAIGPTFSTAEKNMTAIRKHIFHLR